MMRAPWRAIGAALLAGLVCANAAAQPAKPTAAPAATGAAAASASPSSLPPGHPPAGGMPAGHPPTGAATPSGDLPPGHPPTGEMPPGHPPTGSMPPGHPPTGDEGDDSGGGQANPHAGGGQANPHAGGGAKGRSEIFDAPPDTAEDDANLPVGTIILTLKDAQEQPIPNADVLLGIIHNTVAAGESRERKSGRAGADGTLRWDNLPIGSGTSFRASVTREGAEFGTEPFSLSDRAGKRVVLHVYDVTKDPNQAIVLSKAFASVSLGEDSLVVVQRYDLFNLTPIAWQPDNVSISLPEGYKAFNRPDSMDGVNIDEVNGKAVLRGTITPGAHSLSFRFQVPLSGDDKQTVRLETPVRVVRAQVVAEAGKTTGLSVRGEPEEGGSKSLDFPGAKKTRSRDGKRILVTELQAMSREDGPLRVLEVTLTGLPTAGGGRWIALALGVLALIAGGVYVQGRLGQKEHDEEARADLLDARAALLREIVELERAHRAGEIGPKTYQRLRNALLDALDRLLTKIAETSPKKPSRPDGRPLSRDAVADAEE